MRLPFLQRHGGSWTLPSLRQAPSLVRHSPCVVLVWCLDGNPDTAQLVKDCRDFDSLLLEVAQGGFSPADGARPRNGPRGVKTEKTDTKHLPLKKRRRLLW